MFNIIKLLSAYIAKKKSYYLEFIIYILFYYTYKI